MRASEVLAGLWGIMSGSDQTNASQSQADRIGPQVARTKKNLTGIDDIGLPSGIELEELPKLAMYSIF